MRSARVNIETIGRLREAACRYGITQAEIMRRASVAYFRGVVMIEKRSITTRDDSMPIQCLGLSEDIPAHLYGPLADAYLDEKDKGGRLPQPVISREDEEVGYIMEAQQL